MFDDRTPVIRKPPAQPSGPQCPASHCSYGEGRRGVRGPGGNQECASTPCLPVHHKAVLPRAEVARRGRGGGEGTLRAGRLRRTLPWDPLASRPWKAPSGRECGHWVPLCVASTRPPRLPPPAQEQTLAEARPLSAHGQLHVALQVGRELLSALGTLGTLGRGILTSAAHSSAPQRSPLRVLPFLLQRLHGCPSPRLCASTRCLAPHDSEASEAGPLAPVPPSTP